MRSVYLDFAVTEPLWGKALQNQMNPTSHFRNGFGTNLAAFIGSAEVSTSTTALSVEALARCCASDFGTGTLPLLPFLSLDSASVGEPVYRGLVHGHSCIPHSG